MALGATTLSGLASGEGGYEHFTWFNALPGFDDLDHSLAGQLGHTYWQGTEVPTVRHVVLALLMTVVALTVATLAGRRLRNKEAALVPETRLTPANFYEVVLDAVLGTLTEAVGERYAKRVLPLVATVATYVFFSNILGLIPGFAPPTENLNATLAPAIVVFLATHYYGLREHGVVGYFKHFLGPVIYIAPLYFLIEIVGHLSRVMSLSFRLMGNMIGDHKVISAFLGLTAISFVWPLPMLALGLVVCVVQTLVFSLLTIVYIQLAVAHAGGEEHH
jgi:F-type H+-transporting ATPase subunit a